MQLNSLEAQLPIYWVPVLKPLYNSILSVTQGPTIWVPGLLGIYNYNHTWVAVAVTFGPPDGGTLCPATGRRRDYRFESNAYQSVNQATKSMGPGILSMVIAKDLGYPVINLRFESANFLAQRSFIRNLGPPKGSPYWQPRGLVTAWVWVQGFSV